MSVKFEGDYWMEMESLVYNLSNLKINTNVPFGKKWLFLGEAGIGLIAFRTLQTEFIVIFSLPQEVMMIFLE